MGQRILDSHSICAGKAKVFAIFDDNAGEILTLKNSRRNGWIPTP